MKRIAFLLIAGAMLAACSREYEDPVRDSAKPVFTMEVISDGDATKTVVADDGNGGYAVSWQAGDRLGVYEVANGTVQAKATSSPLASAASPASFTFALEGEPQGPFDYTFVYPASALGYANAKYQVTLPAEQTFAANSFDPAADVLVSLPTHTDVRPAAVSASLARLGGTARMLIKAPATSETVQKIIFSSTSSYLAGSYELNPATGELSEEMLPDKSKVITLTPASATTYTGDLVVWFRLAKVTLTDNFTVSVVTDAKTYTKTLYLNTLSRSLEFRNSVLTTFGIDMREVGGVENFRTDVINATFTGVPSTTYEAWSEKTGSSTSAVYAGKTAKRSGGEMGLRQQNNDCGIVTTSSGGTVRAVGITVHNETNNTRTVNVYAKNSAYSAASDLFGDNKGTLIQSVVFPANTPSATETVVVPDNYTYVGINCPSYSVDVAEIRVTWEGAPLPDVTTGAATDVTSAGATLAGVLYR